MENKKSALMKLIRSLIIVSVVFLSGVSVVMVLFFRVSFRETTPCHALLHSRLGFFFFLFFVVGALAIILLLFRLLRQYSLMRADIEQQLKIDPVSGLYNRQTFEERLKLEISRSSRYTIPFSLVLFDLDGLKMINDFFGRKGGDFIIRETADAVRKLIRDVDTLFYLGNGTYALILPSTPLSGAFVLSERLRHSLTGLGWEYSGREIAVTASFGVSQLQEGDQADQLFIRVENLVFRAKKTGRNRVC